MESFDCLKECPDLGRCCREFAIASKNTTLGFMMKNEVSIEITRLARSHGFPFVAKFYSNEIDTWFFTCPRLSYDGSCMDYEKRPEICKNFKPKSNSLCCVKKDLKEIVRDFYKISMKLLIAKR